jgi:plastocyanin
MSRVAAAAVVAAVVAGACGPAVVPGARPSATPSAPTRRLEPPAIPTPTDAVGKPVVMVWMGEHYYSPSTLTVPVGTTVMWWMLGTQEHDVWAYDGSFHSPTMGPGSTYTHTFTKAGTFKYFCVPHYGDGMEGEIVVK